MITALLCHKLHLSIWFGRLEISARMKYIESRHNLGKA
jgi:hypothetical protein